MPEETQNQQQTADQQAETQAGGQEQQTQETSTQEEAKTFTQDDVNGIAAKEAKKAQEKLLKQLGISDVKSAKDGLAKFKEWQESQKSDVEKQAEQLKTLETEKGTLSDENITLKAQVSAMKAGVKADSVEDVVTLAKTMVTDDVDMDAAIKKVVEKYPHFAGEQEEEGKPSFTTGQHKKQSKGDAFATALLGK